MDESDKMIKALRALPEEEMDDVFDSGIYNEVLLGYTTIIMQAAGQAREFTENALETMAFVMDQRSASAARRIYRQFMEEGKVEKGKPVKGKAVKGKSEKGQSGKVIKLHGDK